MDNEPFPKLLYATAESLETSENIATSLVENKLVACANILGPNTAIYLWEGEVVKENEFAIILKTKASLVQQTIARIIELHAYDCPAIIVLDIR